MASSARVFSQTLRFARNLKNGGSKVQKLASCFHVTNQSKNLSQLSQLSRPVASVCGLLNGQPSFNLKTKNQFAPQQVNCSILTRSAAYLSPTPTEASEDGISSSESGSDSSCEAMEGPHGDDDGLVIRGSYPDEDL